MRAKRGIGSGRSRVAGGCAMVLIASLLLVSCQEGSVVGKLASRLIPWNPAKSRGGFAQRSWLVLMNEADPVVIQEGTEARWPDCVIYEVSHRWRDRFEGWWAPTNRVRYHSLTIDWSPRNYPATDERIAGDRPAILALLRQLDPGSFVWASDPVRAWQRDANERRPYWPGYLHNSIVVSAIMGLLWAAKPRQPTPNR